MSIQFDSERVAAGYSGYTSLTLHLYDAYVIRFCNRFIWRCESRELLALYQRNVSACHLDVGVGTGYFLDRTQFPAVRPVITLLDATTLRLSQPGPPAVSFQDRLGS